jgi:hypothetical protein
MKASEIVDKLKSVLLSAEEPQLEAAEEQVEELELSAEQVEEIEVNEPVVLAEDGEEPSEEVAEDSPEEMKYATKQELESAVAEMRAMYEAIMEKMGSDELETEIPNEELSKQEDQVDLSADEPAAEPLAHTPEVEEEQKLNFFKASKPRNTMSVVYEKMFNK